MRSLEIGGVIRALRHGKGWTQRELAAKAGVSQKSVSRAEREASDRLALWVLRRIGQPLGLTMTIEARWRGGELARLLDADHAAVQNAVKLILERAGWVVAVELTFNVYGDRGSYDLLAWHPATGVLLVVEIKTVIADVQGILRPLNVKVRHAREAARGLGWNVSRVVSCLVVVNSSTARRRIDQHSALFARFALRGREARRWLQDPRQPIDGGAGLLILHKLHLVVAGLLDAREGSVCGKGRLA